MEVIKKLGIISLIILSALGLVIDCFFIYFKFINKDVTIGTNYIDQQIGLDIKNLEDLTAEEIDIYEDRYFMEANYYSNESNNGIALQELKFNYFMDYTLTSDKYRATGMQYMGDLKQSDLIITKTTEKEAQKYQSSSFSYYDTIDGISYSGNKLNTQLNRESAFTIKIDNRAFQIQLTGSYEWSEWYGHWYTLGIPIEHENILYYNYLNVFADCMEAIRSNSMSYGDYYIVVDLSTYFSIREFDLETGKYKADDVTDIITNYTVLKFHYDKNGAIKSSQSIFNCIDCNPNYGEINADYWQERVIVNLDESNLAYRYSEVDDGYYVYLTLKDKELFKGNRYLLNITIDLKDNFINDIDLLGIDYDGFSGVNINKLTILSRNLNYDFKFLSNCLMDTYLNRLEYSHNVTLVKSETFINSEYTEVIL